MAAFCFDQAVTLFGQSVEAAIADATRDAKDQKAVERKAKQVIDRWVVDDNDGPKPTEKKFKDPAQR